MPAAINESELSAGLLSASCARYALKFVSLVFFIVTVIYTAEVPQQAHAYVVHHSLISLLAFFATPSSAKTSTQMGFDYFCIVVTCG